jgi:hypothetical protein
MHYLVQMKIVAQARPATSAEGVAFFNEYFHPTTFEDCALSIQQRLNDARPQQGGCV